MRYYIKEVRSEFWVIWKDSFIEHLVYRASTYNEALSVRNQLNSDNLNE